MFNGLRYLVTLRQNYWPDDALNYRQLTKTISCVYVNCSFKNRLTGIPLLYYILTCFLCHETPTFSVLHTLPFGRAFLIRVRPGQRQESFLNSSVYCLGDFNFLPPFFPSLVSRMSPLPPSLDLFIYCIVTDRPFAISCQPGRSVCARYHCPERNPIQATCDEHHTRTLGATLRPRDPALGESFSFLPSVSPFVCSVAYYKIFK